MDLRSSLKSSLIKGALYGSSRIFWTRICLDQATKSNGQAGEEENSPEAPAAILMVEFQGTPVPVRDFMIIPGTPSEIVSWSGMRLPRAGCFPMKRSVNNLLSPSVHTQLLSPRSCAHFPAQYAFGRPHERVKIAGDEALCGPHVASVIIMP